MKAEWDFWLFWYCLWRRVASSNNSSAFPTESFIRQRTAHNVPTIVTTIQIICHPYVQQTSINSLSVQPHTCYHHSPWLALRPDARATDRSWRATLRWLISRRGRSRWSSREGNGHPRFPDGIPMPVRRARDVARSTWRLSRTVLSLGFVVE